MNITTMTTIVSNVQLDDNIRVWLLEKEGFKNLLSVVANTASSPLKSSGQLHKRHTKDK